MVDAENIIDPANINVTNNTAELPRSLIDRLFSKKKILDLDRMIDELAKYSYDDYKNPSFVYPLLLARVTGRKPKNASEWFQLFKENYEPVDFSEFVKPYIKDNCQYKSSDYSLFFAEGKRSNDDFLHYVFIDRFNKKPGTPRKKLSVDGNLKFILTHQDKSVASISFNMGRRKLSINQIQGSHNYDVIKHIKWQNLLVDYLVKSSRNWHIPEVEIVSAENNNYTIETFNELKEAGIYNNHTIQEVVRMKQDIHEKYVNDAKEKKIRMHVNPVQMFMLYDVTARKCGFKKNDEGNYSFIFPENFLVNDVTLATKKDRDALIDFFSGINHDFVPSLDLWHSGIQELVDKYYNDSTGMLIHKQKNTGVNGVFIYTVKNENSPETYAYIDMLAVSPDSRNSSLLKQLIENGLQEIVAKDISTLRAGVFDYKSQMHKFMGKLGFEKIDVETNAYGSNHDIYIYETQLYGLPIKMGDFYITGEEYMAR